MLHAVPRQFVDWFTVVQDVPRTARVVGEGQARIDAQVAINHRQHALRAVGRRRDLASDRIRRADDLSHFIVAAREQNAVHGRPVIPVR